MVVLWWLDDGCMVVVWWLLNCGIRISATKMLIERCLLLIAGDYHEKKRDFIRILCMLHGDVGSGTLRQLEHIDIQMLKE